MKRVSILVVVMCVLPAITMLAAHTTNAYGTARTTTESDHVELAVTISAAHQDPGADPFDVEIICVDASGLYRWLLRLSPTAPSSLNVIGLWRSASYYGVDTELDAGVAFSAVLTPELVNPGDRLLISIDSDAIATLGPLFTVGVDPYPMQPLRSDILRAVLSIDAEGRMVLAATNLTHVPLLVPLASLVLSLAPTPGWIPETAPDVRWTPDPPLAGGYLVLGPDETLAATLPMPSIPAASAAAYRASMALYAGMADAYPGDYLVFGLPVAWGLSWAYLPTAIP